MFGWLAGLGLLLWSPLWSTRQKLLGMLVWPGGYATAFVLSFAIEGPDRSCWASGGPGGVVSGCDPGDPVVLAALRIAARVILVIAPLLVAAYLYRAAGKRPRPA